MSLCRQERTARLKAPMERPTSVRTKPGWRLYAVTPLDSSSWFSWRAARTLQSFDTPYACMSPVIASAPGDSISRVIDSVNGIV